MSAFGGKRQRKLEPNRDFPTAVEVARLLAAARDNPKSRALLLISCLHQTACERVSRAALVGPDAFCYRLAGPREPRNVMKKSMRPSRAVRYTPVRIRNWSAL